MTCSPIWVPTRGPRQAFICPSLVRRPRSQWPRRRLAPPELLRYHSGLKARREGWPPVIPLFAFATVLFVNKRKEGDGLGHPPLLILVRSLGRFSVRQP